jgi:hypothetical protein
MSWLVLPCETQAFVVVDAELGGGTGVVQQPVPGSTVQPVT